MTFAQFQTSLLNNMRRQTAEYLAEVPNIINSAQDIICQRKKYWFLENRQQFSITQGVGSWWQVTLPAGASYSTITEDIFGVWEVLSSGQNNPIEYLPYDQAITLYYLPSNNPAIAPPGEIESYSETPDYTGIILYPVPIANTSVYVAWRAKSLPDWDGVSQTANNIITNEYYNLLLEISLALSYKFYYGPQHQRYVSGLQSFEQMARVTIDREATQKRWERIKTLPLRKGMEVPRQMQIAPFRTPPWEL